ncbi:MAG: PP2C family protein-serine/threonine phosphatase [Nitrospinales bacterium]
MELINKIIKFVDVHPVVWRIYLGRLLISYFFIPVMLAVFNYRELDSIFYKTFLFIAIVWPHVAFYILLKSKNKKNTEVSLISNLDGLIGGIWIPIVHFSPNIVICFLAIVGLGTITKNGFRSFATCLLSITISAIVGGIIFGFYFDGESNLLITITTGITILILIFAGAYFVHTTSLEIRSAKKRIREHNINLEKELSEAAKYVRAILPEPEKIGPIKTDWRFIPSTSLGGDAFGYHWMDDDHFLVYLVDVSGHGVGAALLSVSVMNVLRSQSLPETDFKDPEQVLLSLNAAFPGEENDDMFFTIWYGVYNKRSSVITYASGGHPPALLLSDTTYGASQITKLWTRNCVIGGMPDTTYQKAKYPIGKECILYVFSDGVYEIQQSDGSMWRFQEFVEYLKLPDNTNVSKLDMLINYAIEQNQGKEFEDDFTILEIKLT